MGDPIPRALLDLLDEAGCSLDQPLELRRAALEALADRQPGRLQQLDPYLLGLRSVELAAEGLPERVGDLRLSRLLAQDAYTTTWLGWSEARGTQGALRCGRPQWRRDPVLLRRLERGVRAGAGLRGLVPMRYQAHGPWPHVSYELGGVSLASLLPAEDPPDPVQLTRWLATGLETLRALHGRGLGLCGLAPKQLMLRARRAELLWLDPLEGNAQPAGDVSELARCLLLLDPDRRHPLVQLMEPWAANPPASTEEACTLLRRALADYLASSRHRLALRQRSADRGDRAARLYAAARQLQVATPPPAGRCVLRAGHDRVLSLVESDGVTVRGGAAAGVPPHGLLPLYSPRRGLDATAARSLLRSWARREDGQEELRRSAQERWGGSDEQGASIVRWLQTAGRLRRAQLTLAYRLRR